MSSTLSRLIAIVDTGPLVAAADRSDPDHQRSLSALQQTHRRLVVPAFCLAEASYLIGARLGASVGALFLESMSDLDVQAPLPEDWPRVAELVRQYRDFALGGADATVVVLAERLNTDLLITLDRRHFTAVRPRHVPAYRILPE